MPLLALLFLVVPILELYVLLQVGHAIGALNTVALLIAVSVVGAWMSKRQGLNVLQRVKTQLERGQMPGAELVDGLLVFFAGALLLTPGFLSDCLAIALLLPPVRAVVRRMVRNWFERRVDIRYQ